MCWIQSNLFSNFGPHCPLFPPPASLCICAACLTSHCGIITAGLSALQHGGLLQQQMPGGGHGGAQAGVPHPQQVTTLSHGDWSYIPSYHFRSGTARLSLSDHLRLIVRWVQHWNESSYIFIQTFVIFLLFKSCLLPGSGFGSAVRACTGWSAGLWAGRGARPASPSAGTTSWTTPRS